MSDERWLDLVQQSVGGAVSEGAMFGSRGLRTGRKFFAIWWHGKLVAKLPAERMECLVGAGEAEPFEPMDGRPMGGWAVLSPGLDWPALADEARAYVAAQQQEGSR
jgi:hypothetical protein